MPAGLQGSPPDGDELPGARERDGRGLDQPWPICQRRRRVDQVMEPDVRDEGGQAERSPDDRVGGEEPREGRRRATDEARAGEDPDGADAGGQHHRPDHQLPGDEEDRDRQPERRHGLAGLAFDQGVVVERCRVAGHLEKDGPEPRHGDEQGSDGRRARGRDRAHRSGSWERDIPGGMRTQARHGRPTPDRVRTRRHASAVCGPLAPRGRRRGRCAGRRS